MINVKITSLLVALLFKVFLSLPNNLILSQASLLIHEHSPSTNIVVEINR